MTRAEFLGRLEPGTMVSIHDHVPASLQRYRVVWRRGGTVCLKLANQKHITSRILHVPERRYVLEGESTMHFLDSRETPTLSITITR